VTGVDHDKGHIEAARALAADKGVDNLSFEIGDALRLPFDDCTFEAVYENDLFTHLAQNAVGAAHEAYRLLRAGGILAARDVAVESVVWGNQSEPIKELDRLMIAWQRERGSDVTLGKRLPAILREAGFKHTIKSVSADSKGDPESVRSHAQITLKLLDGPFGKAILDNRWGDRTTIERLKGAIRAWGEHSDSFFANVHVEVIGWKEVQAGDMPRY
jgi:SAM-dependent methyltransferase